MTDGDLVTKMVPKRLASFAAKIVSVLDSEDPDRFIDADDAVQTSYASGGRLDDGRFLVSYRAGKNGKGEETWSLDLDEAGLRRLAAGLEARVAVAVSHPSYEARRLRGEAFAVWGAGATDGCMLRDDPEVDALLALVARISSTGTGVAMVLGSTHGDVISLVALPSGDAHVAAVLAGGRTAYLSSKGDDAQTEPVGVALPFMNLDVSLTYAECIGLGDALEAVKRLVKGEDVDCRVLVPRIHGAFLIDVPRHLRERGLVVPLAKALGGNPQDIAKKPGNGIV